MGTAIYAQSQAANAAAGESAQGEAGEQADDDEVVEAEIVDEGKPGEEGGAA